LELEMSEMSRVPVAEEEGDAVRRKKREKR
jgi:hypothetical protein